MGLQADAGAAPAIGSKWIADKDNPLTARVMVNRIWQEYFGRGIVRSSDNFGRAGTPPTHPELLAWLARDFVDGGWQIKRMHKRILLSKAYRMSSVTTIREAAPSTQITISSGGKTCGGWMRRHYETRCWPSAGV